jgi:molybdopterin-containing oxidoreductase family iron-sulfur binding subunit
MTDKKTTAKTDEKVSRKKFIGGVGLVSAGLLLGDAMGRADKAAQLIANETDDKPKSKWGMVIDLRRCVGCDACTIACKRENHTPPGVQYNIVLKEELGKYPNVRPQFIPRPCMQCEKPPCVKVCPVGATQKRPDGIISINYQKCIGCRYCMTACPYGARSFDFGENFYEPMNDFEKQPFYEYNREWSRDKKKSPVNNVRKCHYCLHRITRGLQPACVETCVGKARYLGDLNDPDSEVNKLIAHRKGFRLKEELGTEPLTYYLSDN